MTLFGLVLFAGIYLLAVVTPGPGIAALVAYTLAHGRAGAVGFVAGMVLGDLFWFACAVGGLALIAQSFHAAFLVIKYVGVVYLLYLAWKAWTATPDPVALGEMPRPRTALSASATGLAITLGNPKTMVFYLAILPTVIDLKTLTLAGALACAAVIAVVLPLGMTFYVVTVERARALMRSRRGLRLMNRIAGTAMAGAAVTIASR